MLSPASIQIRVRSVVYVRRASESLGIVRGQQVAIYSPTTFLRGVRLIHDPAAVCCIRVRLSGMTCRARVHAKGERDGENIHDLVIESELSFTPHQILDVVDLRRIYGFVLAIVGRSDTGDVDIIGVGDGSIHRRSRRSCRSTGRGCRWRSAVGNAMSKSVFPMMGDFTQ